jgi:hypothetical protein
MKKFKLEELNIKPEDINKDNDEDFINKFKEKLKKNKYPITSKESDKLKNKLVNEIFVDRDQVEELNNVVSIIIKKFPLLKKKYNFVQDAHNIKKGDMIKCITNNLEKETGRGIVVQIDKLNNKSIKSIKFYNNLNKQVWTISPNKYYIFKRKDEHLEKFMKDINEYLEKNKKPKKQD